MYDVSVFDPVSVPNITKLTVPPTHSGCSLTCSVDNGPGVNLTWFRGNANVSCISNQSVSVLALPLHIQAEDSSTYSCQAQNPVSKQRKALDSQRLTCRNAGTAKLWVGPVIGGIIAATLVIIAAAGLFTYCIKRKKGCHVRNRLRSQSNQETSPQNCSSSLTSEEYLLQNVQGSSYETVK
ncbi:carcinoembryonic antigen-related cell adhesion molecule 1-like isoform X2 [Poeciliopsis prolifica]|uniref:carcinoembryonic antigen-related cell adhesion molecule 1-like isoform X2 n=1 Tax=Poeciliopsis prolifica TaxID=188132 RepID=UPI002413EA70|nr:carcinoembryonic antigen-related cell adhesion molecule 1-like isoform X2 [Poeciliopsis prolifica]XP_054879499.1 carcinoembryonic antigen-related cell adhesion molecule 1-like isoform X2 [Poeciliopsis prolifica]